MKDDDDVFNNKLELIGACTVIVIFFFMIVCTVLQVGSWLDKLNTTCEVTVQKE